MKNLNTIKKIGEGSFSNVLLVEDEKSRKLVLKQFKSGFQREARREFLYLNSFDDPHIVKAIEYSDEEKPTLLLEYLKGNELHYSQFSNEKTIYSILTKISETISKIHSAGICLNDLKPENIIIRNNEPVLIDFGLCTLNLYNDGMLRGTISYAAPEKINHQTNHFPADIFSLGIIYLFLTNQETPADQFKVENYKDVLLDKKAWGNYIEKLPIDNFIKKMIAFSPLERPNALKVAKHFAKLSEEKLKDITTLEIKNYTFQNQIEAAQRLIENKKLNCNLFDEPDKIINLLSLLSESKNKKLVVLKEADIISQPELFFRSISSIFQKKIKYSSELIKILKNDSTINVLLKREEPYTTFFNELEKAENILILNKSEKSDLQDISKIELTKFVKNLHFDNLKDFLNNYQATKPYLVRLMMSDLISKDDTKSQIDEKNELILFIANLDIAVPFILIEKIWSNWKELLQRAIQQGKLVLEGESLRFIGESHKNVSAEILTKAMEKAFKLNLYYISARIAFIQKNTELSLEYYEKHIQYLVEQEFYFSAFESYKILYKYFSENQLTYYLKKKEAFLNRICGYPQKALEFYTNIEKGLNELDKAILSTDKAIVLQELGKNEKAVELYKRSAEIFRKHNKIKEFLRTKNNLGVVLIKLKRFRDAQRTYQELLKSAEKHNDAEFITMANLNMADVSLQMGEWKKSLHFAQKASELALKYKKIDIQTYAELYAIQANFSLGNNTGLPKIIETMKAKEKIKENKLLYIYMLSKFLNITEFIDKTSANEFMNELQMNKDQIFDEEIKLGMFFHYYHQNRFFQALEICRELENPEIPEKILKSNTENIIKLLDEIVESGDIYSYLYYASHLVISGNFQKSEKLLNSIKDFLKIYSFSPLEKLFVSEQNTATPEHSSVYWEILNRIHSNVEFSETMEAALSGIITIGKLERAIYFDFKQGDIQPVIGLDNRFHSIKLDNILVSRTILQDTIKQGEIKFLTNLQEDIPFDIHSSIFGLGLRTALCFPLIINNETKGIIYSDATSEKVFTAEDKKVLELILIQANSALGKSDIYENLKKENAMMQYSNNSEESFPEIIGNSKEMQKIFSLMKSIGEYNVNVLITGPTGSGKELIAKALHNEYAKRSPFIVVNCAAIPDQLLESELFGYKKGAFTGAVSDKRGKIELANTGTLFLDEIGDMPISLQAKLLRVIQERIVTPVGSTKEIPVSIRVIAATNQDLEKLVNDKLFRQDLFYRLKVINIQLPALQKRKTDIPLLTYHFIKKFNVKFNKDIKHISADALSFLQDKEWQGNIRELENEIEKAVLLCIKDTIEVDNFIESEKKKTFSVFDNIPDNWKEYMKYKNRINNTLDSNYIKMLLKKTDNNIQKASKIAGMSRTQIYRLMKREDSVTEE
ncbi:MAG: sigma 54-interacting transcriptional regulator [Candidatus Cloacimonetes bacterium]|nr:sigma 54-interacting transcriptional regulator [Candidatus Cloacimonadota bacterium]